MRQRAPMTNGDPEGPSALAVCLRSLEIDNEDLYLLENLDLQTVKSSYNQVIDVSASHDNIAQYHVTPKDPSRSTQMILW